MGYVSILGQSEWFYPCPLIPLFAVCKEQKQKNSICFYAIIEASITLKNEHIWGYRVKLPSFLVTFQKKNLMKKISWLNFEIFYLKWVVIVKIQNSMKIFCKQNFLFFAGIWPEMRVVWTYLGPQLSTFFKVILASRMAWEQTTFFFCSFKTAKRGMSGQG